MPKVVRIHRTGPPEVMVFDDLDLGEPGPGEVRVRIEAIGLNRSEALFRSGRYIAPPALPSRIGYEAAGVVEAVGEAVAHLAPGDPVSILPMFRQGEYGVYAEQAIVPARAVLKRPDWLSAEHGAAVWMAYMTALAIIRFGEATVGDHVLIPAASSSVGLAAIQLCNRAGAVPIAATRTSAKADALRAQGAAHIIATAEQDLAAEVKRITGGKGARIVFDPVGGPGVHALAEAAAQDGIIFIYGSLSGEETPWPHWPAAFKNLSLRGWVASTIWNHPEHFPWAVDLILRGLHTGALTPVIARTFPLADIVEAHRFLESNAQVGKVVVSV